MFKMVITKKGRQVGPLQYKIMYTPLL